MDKDGQDMAAEAATGVSDSSSASVSESEPAEHTVGVEVKPARGSGRRSRRSRLLHDDAEGTPSPDTPHLIDNATHEDEGAESVQPLGAELVRAIEAVVVSSDRPVSAARLAQVLAATTEKSEGAPQGDGPGAPISGRQIRGAIAELNRQYESTGRVFRIEALAGGYRLMTTPDVGPVLAAFHGARQKAALSRAAIESLAIIAYKQPLTRAQLEAIRGVACGEILRSLTERRLVTVVGRADEVGRPILYGTTKQFLEAFGLSSVRDLPTPEELKARAGAAAEDDE